MERIILSSGIEKRETDAERTASEYYKLVSNFIESELFAVNPLIMTDEELDAFAAKRANNPGGSSWIERTGKFYSKCHLEKVQHINDIYSWDQLCFQPWKNLPIVTLSKFRRVSYVYLSNTHELRPLPRKYEVLGAKDNTTSINYYTERVGMPFVYCYQFGVLDEYSPITSERPCLRFAEDHYKREALLLTQHFTISYFLCYPYDCLPCPYLVLPGWTIKDVPAMRTIMAPIFSEKMDSLKHLESTFIDRLRSQDLEPEVF